MLEARPQTWGFLTEAEGGALEQQQVSSNSDGRSLLWAWVAQGCRGMDRWETVPLGGSTAMVGRRGLGSFGVVSVTSDTRGTRESQQGEK